MPYKIIKNKNEDTYRVVNVFTKDIKAKNTTKDKAIKLVRLLKQINNKKKN